jgi:hypothetical protein
MSNNDLVINSVATPNNVAIMKKPIYLISLENKVTNNTTAKKKNSSSGDNFIEYFICFDKPEIDKNFIQVKGFFTNQKEEVIVSSFTDIINSTSKEMYLDIIFPSHRIISIRSLVFNAVKK